MLNFSKTTRKNLQDPTEPVKTYAVAQSRKTIDLEELAQHMTGHYSPFSAGTIEGILKDMVTCARHCLLDGLNLRIGSLGSLAVVLDSEGVCESVEDEDTGKKPVFTAANIRQVNVRFTPGKSLQNLIAEAKFNEVETLEKQAEHLKEKAEQRASGTSGGSGGSNEHE